MTADPFGYYRTLGVTPGATANEIKAAFRRLSKELHPDHNQAPDAASAFQKVAEAYACLNDDGKRAEYDAIGITAGTPESNKVEPIKCSRCEKVTAQPRYVVFRHVVSFITKTVTTPIQGIFCAECARKQGLKASAISAAAGWWGVPFGPILTIKEIVSNALGGHRPKGTEQKLLWINALAFYTKGDFKLAYGLARRVQGLQGDELATDASALISELSRRGVAKNFASLKTPWALRPAVVSLHLVMGALLPAALAALIITSPRTTTAAGVAEVATAGSPISASANDASPAPLAEMTNTQQNTVEAVCLDQPVSGTLLGGRRPKAKPGNRLTIKNGSEGPVIVKVRRAPDGPLAFSFFVSKGGSATILHIPDGAYRVQYALGDHLQSDCRTLGGIMSVAALPGDDTLSTRIEGDRIVTSELSYTLYPVAFGNVHPQTIPISDFNAD